MDPVTLTACNGEWSNLQLSLQWIYEGPVSSSGRRGSFHPDKMAAWLLRKGSVCVEHEGHRLQAGAGDWVIPWSGFRHQEFSPDAELLSVHFEAHWPDGKPLFDRGLSIRFPAALHPELEQGARRLFRAASLFGSTEPLKWLSVSLGLDDYLKIHRLVGQFVRALTTVLRGHGLQPTRLGIRDERVRHAVAWLDTQSLEIRFRESELAARVGLGEKQFVRLFRAATGVTPRRYFEQRRREGVMRLLLGSTLSIKEIASNLGFAHLSDFSAWFKDLYGLPPRDFRRLSLTRELI